MHFEILAWGADVGVGAASARYCTIEGVAKVNFAGNDVAVVDEYICARLGMAIGLPVPPGAIVRDGAGIAYVAWRFGVPGAGRPPPVVPADLIKYHPDLSAGIVAFDHWIYNDDRHAENLAFTPPDIPPAVFDHERALLGTSMAGVPARLLALTDTAPAPGCLAALLPDADRLRSWIERISSVPDGLIRSTCMEAVAYGGIDLVEATMAAMFLIHRRETLTTVLQATMSAVNPGASP